jgi:sugar lactone lactonase YvrE
MAGEEFRPGIVAMISPDGSARRVADGLAFPNGMLIMPDGQTLIVAESYARQLTAFDRGCFACALGGRDRDTLFMVATEWNGPGGMFQGEPTGQVLTINAPAPGAGWP